MSNTGYTQSVSVIGPNAERVIAHVATALSTCDGRAYESAASALDGLGGASEQPYCAAVVVTDATLSRGVFSAYRTRWPDVACFLYTSTPPTEFDPDTPIYEFVHGAASPEALAERVAYAVGNRTHTAYPLPDDEHRRLRAVESLDIEALVDHVALRSVLDPLSI